jgi:hypothetical protein
VGEIIARFVFNERMRLNGSLHLLLAAFEGILVSLSALTFKLYWNLKNSTRGGLSKPQVLAIDRLCVAVPLVLLSTAYLFDSGGLENENGRCFFLPCNSSAQSYRHYCHSVILFISKGN